MNIILKPEQEKLIESLLENGTFDNAEDAIDLAFKFLERLNNEEIQWIESIREKIDLAVAELDRGEALDGETVVNDILARFRENRNCEG